MLLFVYGCLKRGGYLSEALNESKFLKTTRTLPKFRLYDVLNFPGMIFSNDGNAIVGELWEVSDEDIKEIDFIEGTHIDLFKRELIELEDNTKAFAYIYSRELSSISKDIGTEWVN